MMRVLVYGCAGQLYGGIESFLLNMNEHMSDGCIFDYIIVGEKCLHTQRINQQGGQVLTLPAPRHKPLAHVVSLGRLLKQQRKVSRVLYVNLYSAVQVLPVLLGRLCGYRVVLHAHNSGVQSRGRLYAILHCLGRRILQMGRYIRWTNSAASADFMFGRNAKAELIYNAIKPEQFRFDSQKRNQIRSTLEAENALVIGFAGRLEEPKNPMFLLEIFHALLQKEPQAQLWIAGEGSLRQAMQEKTDRLNLQKSVTFLGQRDDIAALMQGMDIFLLPSRFEGLGIALIEAQAAGLFCVAADTVPPETAVTGRVRYLSLNAPISNWVNACLNQNLNEAERILANEQLLQSNFTIQKEATRMETLLQAIHSNDRFA